MGGDKDGFLHESALVLVANVNWNSSKWNVNDWDLDENGQWNAGNRVFSRNRIFSPVYLAGVFDRIPFRHPPSILPVSSIGSERAIYFFVSICLCSHAICRKNLTRSRERILASRYASFFSVSDVMLAR